VKKSQGQPKIHRSSEKSSGVAIDSLSAKNAW